MGSRRFEITVVSAENLPDIRRLGRMKVYAVVSVDGSMDATNVDRDGDTCPTWDFPFVYKVKEAQLQHAGLDAVVDLYCERSLGTDKLIGRVVIPVKTLFEKGLKSQRTLSFPIAGTAQGRLYVRYCFEEKDLALKGMETWGRRQFGADELRLTRASFDFRGDNYYNYNY